MNNLIETGKIANTHGVRGELKIQPWADSPQTLMGVQQVYIDKKPIKILSSKVHKGNLIVSLEGVDTIEKAIALKGKTVSVNRNDIKLSEGTYFIADLIGLTAIDTDTGDEIGKIGDVLTLPAHNVYVVKCSNREMLIPAVPEFIVETNLTEGYVRLKVIEGL